MATFIRFECGQEDRYSEEFGPYEWVQITYSTIRVGEDGETELAEFAKGWWWTDPNTKWSDFVVYDK